MATESRDYGLIAGYLALVVVAAPFALFILATGIDLSSWCFTGHEVFPWIGRALNG